MLRFLERLTLTGVPSSQLNNERLLRVRKFARLHRISLLTQQGKPSGKLQLQMVQSVGIRSFRRHWFRMWRAVAGTCRGFVPEVQISLFLSIGLDATLQLVIAMRSSQVSCQTYDKGLNECTTFWSISADRV